MTTPNRLDETVLRLVPSLSRSLAEQFNVFRVMHHGTHEKQLSNVFAWLLRPDGTHGLGDRFQQIFLERVNESPAVATALPTSGYGHVAQEVDTSLGNTGKDIADIVLTRSDARVVIENFGTSDGHGHDFQNYLAHGRANGRRAAVVLLCIRHEPALQRDGWQDAAVVTYASVLGDLKAAIAKDTAWRRGHQQQHSFLHELFQHFLEGTTAMSVDERIGFLKVMCETGESARYGYKHQESASSEFAALVADHARRQFDDGRKTLAEVKRALKNYGTHTLMDQVNDRLPAGKVIRVEARFAGQWEWSVALRRTDSAPDIFLTFGPSAVVENNRVPVPLTAPDYGKVFVTRQASEAGGVDLLEQTEVGLDEVLDVLPADDTRLRDAVLSAISAASPTQR